MILMGICKHQVKKGPVIWADDMYETSASTAPQLPSCSSLLLPSRIMLDLKGRKLTFIK